MNCKLLWSIYRVHYEMAFAISICTAVPSPLILIMRPPTRPPPTRRLHRLLLGVYHDDDYYYYYCYYGIVFQAHATATSGQSL